MSLWKNLKSKKSVLFLFAFFFLNILNSHLVTSSLYNRSIRAYPKTLFMVINSILGDFGYLLLICAIALLLFRREKRRFRFLIGYSFVNAIVCIGLMIISYNYNGMMFSFGNLKALNNPAGRMALDFVFAALWSLLKHAQFVSLIPPILLIVILRLLKFNQEDSQFIGGGKDRFFFVSGMFVLGILLMVNSLGSYRIEIEETWYEENRDVLYGVQSVGLYNYYMYDFYTYYFTDIYEVTDEKAKEIKGYLEEYKSDVRKNPLDGNFYGSNTTVKGSYANQNFILIQAESLNNYTIGLRVNGKEVTPNLNRLVKQGLYFDNFYTTVGIGNTSDAEFSVMTGLYPNGEDLSIYTFGKGNYDTLAKDFKKEGYETASFHGNTKLFYSRQDIHPNLYGFDHHYGLEDLSEKDPLVHGWISDESLLKQVVDHMVLTPGLDFSYAVLVSCHTPYLDDLHINQVLAKEGFSLRNDISDEMLRGYLEHTFYVDYAIGKMMEYIRAQEGLEDVIVALYGDHGGGISHESFLQNRYVLTNNINPFEATLYQFPYINSTYAYQKLSQEVPFIIYEVAEEAINQPRTIHFVRGQTDIYRTIANLFALDNTYYFGVDALSDAPQLIYNPRNLDVFTDEFVLFIPPMQTYSYPYFDSYKERPKYIASLLRQTKAINDKILKYKNYKVND